MDAERVAHDESVTPEEWETVKELVFNGQTLDPSERKAWLDTQCPPGRVRREVERLLAIPPLSPSFLHTSAPARVLGAAALAPAFPFRVGHFQVTHELGAGGMGVVYAAVDERLGRKVALKILRPDIEIDDEHRRRLLWDARAASALNHPNVVCVYEAGEDDGVQYVAMELVSGRTLADALAATTPAVPQSQLLGYAVQIAAALRAAHADGIVHRDVKPSNVMITDEGIAKLVDFGLAKSVGGPLTDRSAPPTLEGRLAGTAAYMSPEQAEGGAIDFRSDIFSFGSVLYEMMTRRRAFSGGSVVSVLSKILHGEPQPTRALLPALDPRLEDIVNRCLRKDRDRRFQSMADVQIRLQEVIDDDASGTVVLPRTSGRRSSTLQWATLVLSAALLASAAFLVWRPAPAPSSTPSLTRLTWDGGLTTSPALSADGTMLAYASDRAGRGDLDVWVQRMQGNDPIRLTNDPADESTPSFSPDGTRIAYRSERDGGGVYVMPSLGGTERLVVPGCKDPAFSPDGKSIACWIGNVGGAFYPGSAWIVIVPSSGGQPRRFRPDFDNAAYPLWTRDGKGLIFLARKIVSGKAVMDWWFAPDAPGGERPTGAMHLADEMGLAGPEGLYWMRPEAWSADGRRLLFSARHGDTTNVWSLDIDARMQTHGPARAMTSGTGVEAFPRTSGGTDASVVFASLFVDVQLRRLPLSADAAHGTPERLLPSLSQIGSPSISTDGRLLVFTARQPDGYRVVSVDTSTAEQRTVTTVEARRFVRTILSGDGSSIVYSADRLSYRMRIDGVPERICDKCGWPTHLNAAGTEVLFESAVAAEQLLLWSDGTIRPLVSSPDPEQRMQFGGRFSPDGRWVTFCASSRAASKQTRQIVVVPKAPERPLRADEWITISDGSTTDREPYWSPDGRRIFYLSDQDGFRCIWARAVDPATARPSGAAYPVAHFHHARELLGGPIAAPATIGLSASQNALIFTVANATGNVWGQGGRASR